MKRISKITGLVLAILTTGVAQSQLKIDAELRPRFELRHGYKSLHPDGAKPAAFISQRVRLNAGYKIKKFDFYLSLQDVRVWGNVPQLNASDVNGFSLHQAWANIGMGKYFSTKFGRQEIIYDDSRIFGNVGWAQQARSHDALLFKFNKDSLEIDLGLAYNQDKEGTKGNVLTVPRTYKTFQYLWLRKRWKKVSASFLFLSNGMQYIDTADASLTETRFSFTAGTHLKYQTGNFGMVGNAYYQFGRDVKNNTLNAYLFGLELSYKLPKVVTLKIGGEIQRGNDHGKISNRENRAFSPLYGTNHKFNGLMDYFYVGNHVNSIGLLDLYFKMGMKFGPKSNLSVAFHNFSSPAYFVKKELGGELDLVYAHKFNKIVTLKVGYSHLFASSGMRHLKGNFDGNANLWGWVMVVVKPTFLNKTFEKQKK